MTHAESQSIILADNAHQLRQDVHQEISDRTNAQIILMDARHEADSLPVSKLLTRMIEQQEQMIQDLFDVLDRVLLPAA